MKHSATINRRSFFKKIAVAFMLLVFSVAGARSLLTAPDAAALSTTHRIHRIPSYVGYPDSYLPAWQGDQNGKIYIKTEAWPYAGATPASYGYYNDVELEKGNEPFFVYTMMRDGKKVASCRKDWGVFDNCNSSALVYIDYNVSRGNYYTYSAYVQMYERDPRCAQNYPDDLTYCGPQGNERLVSTGPTFTAEPVYVGTENWPGMDLDISYNGKAIAGDGTSAEVKVPKGASITARWTHTRGDPPSSCTLYKQAPGSTTNTPITTTSGAGTATFNAGEELGTLSIRIGCTNGYFPPGSGGEMGSTSKVMVVESLASDYYDDAEDVGGGGSGIAIPDIENRTDGGTTNVFSETDGSFVEMAVSGCSTKSAGFINDTTGEDTDFTYPFGIMAFTLECETNGTTATVKKHYFTEANPENAVLRKYNSKTKVFTTIGSATIRSITYQGRKALEVTYQVTDGGSLDEDGTKNGTIVDPVALGISEKVEEHRESFETDCSEADLSSNSCGIIYYIEVFSNILAAVVGLVIVIMIVAGGVQYASARDNPELISAAKKKITNALLALVVFIFLTAFLEWIIPGGIL